MESNDVVEKNLQSDIYEVVKESLNQLSKNNKVLITLVITIFYLFYNMIYYYPYLLSIIFNVYPIHNSLIYLRNTKNELNNDISVILSWFVVVFVESLRIFLNKFPLVRIVFYCSGLYYVNNIVKSDSQIIALEYILQLHEKLHNTILKELKYHNE